MSEIVYVLTNEAMLGLVKIGRTNSITRRISELSQSSGVPIPFECYFAAKVKDSKTLESKLHQLFAESRYNPKREFFKIAPERVVLAISIGEFEDVTPDKTEAINQDEIEGIQALEKLKAKRTKTLLSALGLKEGDELVLSRDESIVVTVTNDERVIYDEEPMSLSGAALKALHKIGYKTPAASGAAYWMFEGELLSERRRRMETAQFGQDE